jgi:hypothetical protein
MDHRIEQRSQGKILEANTEENLCKLEVGKHFLERM